MDLLSSARANDEISGEVVELVGFDHIELVMDLLGSRRAVTKEVSVSAFILPCCSSQILQLSLHLDLRKKHEESNIKSFSKYIFLCHVVSFSKACQRGLALRREMLAAVSMKR